MNKEIPGDGEGTEAYPGQPGEEGRGSLQEEDDRQCVMYYSNPNFLMDNDVSTSIQFGMEEGEEGDMYEEDDLDAMQLDGMDSLEHLDNHTTNHQDEPESITDEYYESCNPHTVPSIIHSRQRPSQQRLVFGAEEDWSWKSGCSMKTFLSVLVSCLRSRPCLFFVYILVVLVLLSSFVALILISVLVVEPYLTVRGFTNSSCSAWNISYGREHQSCSCGKGCNSKYRCIRIRVSYRDDEGMTSDAILYEDETSLNRQCSFYPSCRSSRSDNDRAVTSYEHHYGRAGLEYDCYYNPAAKAQVIQRKRFKTYHVVNGLTWSLVLLIVSVVFLVYALRSRGCFHT